MAGRGAHGRRKADNWERGGCHGETKLALHESHGPTSGTKLALLTPSHRTYGTKLALLTQKGTIWRVLPEHGELCTAVTANKPCRANFVPLSPPTSHAGRTLYRMRGSVGASDNSTPDPTGAEGQAAAPAGGNDTTASQISHVIYRGHFSRCPKNVAIPTMQIRSLNESSRNYVRNC